MGVGGKPMGQLSGGVHRGTQPLIRSVAGTKLTNQTQPYEPQRNERLRARRIRPLVPFPANGRLRTRNRNPVVVSLFRLAQKQPQVTLSNLTH